MKFRVSKEEMIREYDFPSAIFPKYTSQIMNLANQNAQGTRPAVVGQMSELFPEYKNSVESPSIEGWAEWYLERYPDAIERATDKVEQQVENLKRAIPLIDRNMIKRWVTDLVINKTCMGLYYQQVILTHLAEVNHSYWRLATPEEEAKGIDGYVDGHAYSIKPTTYKTMNRLPEEICVTIVYYSINANSGDLMVTIDD